MNVGTLLAVLILSVQSDPKDRLLEAVRHVDSLQAPYSYPSEATIGAVGWRLRRNYLWIYLAVLVTWVAKMEISSPAQVDLIAAASFGGIPGIVVWVVVIVFYATLIAIGVLAQRSYPMGSDAARAVLSQEPD